jgi:hypothetical protein
MRSPLFFLVSVVFLQLVVPAFAEITAAEGIRDHMRGTRYGEIILITGGPFSFTGHVYNTIGLNNCPEAAWKALDPALLKSHFKAVSVMLNGPRYFMMDEASLHKPGSVERFGELQARHLADVQISLMTILHGRAKPYTENSVKRTSMFLYRKGCPIYQLTSPDGRVYVMQTYSLIVDPNLTQSQLPTLGQRLRLLSGWSYKVCSPDRNLHLRSMEIAHVLQDDLENSYQRLN